MLRTHLTRRERLALAGSALGGAVAGAFRALTSWLLEEFSR
ncbi:hypothetical protein ACFYO5_11245 [Streptomyces sp. NPDC006259]